MLKGIPHNKTLVEISAFPSLVLGLGWYPTTPLCKCELEACCVGVGLEGGENVVPCSENRRTK